MRIITAQDLISRAHRMVDIPEDSTSRTDAPVSFVEMLAECNSGLVELHDLVTGEHHDFYMQKADLAVASGDTRTSLPEGFAGERKIYLIDAGARVPLEPFNHDDLDGGLRATTTTRPRYKITGEYLWWSEPLQSAYTVELWYIRQYRELTHGGDIVQPEIPFGWTDYVVGHMGAYLAAKKELDPSYPLSRKKAAAQRVLSGLAKRTLARTTRSRRNRQDRRYPRPTKP